MVEPDRLLVRVASLLEQPRNLPPAQADAVYRAGEALALGLDIALSAHGVKRTRLIAQAANRAAFAEAWAPPGGPAAFEQRLLALDAGPPAALLAETDPPLPRIRMLIGQSTYPTRFPHLLGHTEAPWYYVPRDFPRPIWLDAPRPQSAAPSGPARVLSVGSVPALLRELEALDALLAGAGLDPAAWFPAPLLEATALSLEIGLPVIVQNTEH